MNKYKVRIIMGYADTNIEEKINECIEANERLYVLDDIKLTHQEQTSVIATIIFKKKVRTPKRPV